MLEPFFNHAHSAIRSLDNETLVFWEPVTYAYLAGQWSGLSPCIFQNWLLITLQCYKGENPAFGAKHQMMDIKGYLGSDLGGQI